MTRGALPIALFELVIAPAAFALAWRHARRALGWPRAWGELTALALYGFALEAAAMSAFGSHRYAAGWRVAPLGVPVAIALVWAAVISSALTLAARRGLRPAAARAGGAALIAVTLDLLIEPAAAAAGLWEWTPPGPWLAVPIGNFVGWAVIVGVYALGAERFAGADGVAGEAARRTALVAASIAALLAVGAVWRGLGLESAFERGGGWLFWGSVVASAIALGGRRGPPFEGGTLAGRLGAAPGAGPVLVFLMVALAFAAQAALVRRPALAVAALGPALALVWVLRPAPEGGAGGPR